MAKRKEDTPPAGSPAWMSTFSDLMNLLLCFFVMLFAMSSVDEQKFNELVSAMSNSFSIFDAGAKSIGDGMLINNGVSQLNDLDSYINSTGKTAESKTESEKVQEYENMAEELLEAIEQEKLQNNEELAETIQEAIEESGIEEQIDINFTSQYVELTMKGSLLFDSGSAELKDQSFAALNKIGIILERYADDIIEIVGHTDNVPIHSSRFADNEQLSSARALSVFYYFQENTSLDSMNLRHAGMGERVPVADNSTEEGRTKNRRVEIRIYNS